MNGATKIYSSWLTMPILCGVLLWLGSAIFVVSTGLGLLRWIQLLFLLAPLIIVPLGLSLIESSAQPDWGNIIRVVQPVGAIGVVASFLAPIGWLAASLAGVWLGVTLLLALLGLGRLWSRGSLLPIEELVVDAGLLFLPVGGGWLVLFRLGANPLDFNEVVVLLTAVHFHYAGFAALIFVGMVGRFLAGQSQPVQKLYNGAALGVLIGTPLVAAGITFSPLVELVGAVVLATSLAIIAGLAGVFIVPAVAHRLAQGLLGVAALSLLVGMSFTYLYAISEFTGFYLIHIPQMAQFHGLANAVGFGVGGLWGWSLLWPQPEEFAGSTTKRRLTPPGY